MYHIYVMYRLQRVCLCSRFRLFPEWTEEEFAHWLLPQPGTLDTFVTHDTATGAVTDLLSMYHLPASNLGCAKHTDLQSMYVFYVVPGRHSMVQLLSDATALAKQVSDCGFFSFFFPSLTLFSFDTYLPLRLAPTS